MNKQQEPRLRFQGFTGEWKTEGFESVGEFNPKAEIPQIFQYVDLESVVGTQLISYREEFKETAPSRAQRLAKNGDLFFQAVRPYQKNNYLFEKNNENFVFSTGYIQIRPQNDGYFLLTLVQKEEFVQEVLLRCTGTSYPAINTSSLQNIAILIPPTAEEQAHLGNFFRRLDSQIAESRTVLEKSRQLKKAMLAKMFPANGEKIPKIRFKGFEGEWEEKSLGKLAEQIKSYPLSRNVETLENTGFKYIHYGDIHRGIADIIYSDKVLPNIQAGNFELLKRGDLIIADVSEDYEGVGAACVIDGPLKDKVVSGLHTIAIRPNQTSPLFLYYLLKTQEFKQYGRLVGTGTKVVGITASKFLSFQTHIPTVLEQTAIGNFFRQLDETIALQLAEVEKLNQLKKGLLAAMLI